MIYENKPNTEHSSIRAFEGSDAYHITSLRVFIDLNLLVIIVY